MLNNTQTLPESINLSQLFKKMLNELPWTTFANFLRANAGMFKMLSIGGYRMDVKNRRRLEDIVCREGEKKNYDIASISGLVFTCWYPLQGQLHQQLEEYFHSDAHKEYLKQEELPEETYCLPEEMFDSIYKKEDRIAWQILLSFSPMTLSDRQIEQITSLNCSPEEARAQLEACEKELTAAQKQLTQNENEIQRLRAELNEQKAQLTELKKKNEQDQTRINSLQNENQKLRKQAQESHTEVNDVSHDEILKSEKLLAAAKNELEKSKNEVLEWKKRYEAHCVGTKDKDRQIASFKDDIETLNNQIVHLKKQIEKREKFADNLLSRFDWKEIGAQLKLTANVKQQFNALVKKINYEEHKEIGIEQELPAFWEALGVQEKHLIEQIADSDNLEISCPNAADLWDDLEEQFEDVLICLEAKTVLLKLLQSIFCETINNEALNTPNIYATLLKK